MNKRLSTKQFSDTNIDEVKRLNANSGLSYNETLELLAFNYRQNKKLNKGQN